MDDLIKISNKEGVLVVSSREVAGNFEKEHRSVLKAVDDLIVEMGVAQNYAGLFIATEYRHEQNKQVYREYLLTRDGFSLLVMGFTGKKALEWKLRYIEAFNKMEQELLAPKKLSAMEQLKLQYEVLDEHDERISYLENNMTIDYGQQLELQTIAKSRALVAMGGTSSASYKDARLRSKIFSAIWKDYKDYFEVNSYRNTSKKDYEKARKYLEGWQVQGKLLREVEEANSQLKF